MFIEFKMVEQQKIDIAEESTTTAKKKKEIEEHNSTSDKEDQENADYCRARRA